MLQDTNEKYYELKGEVYTNVIGGHGAIQLNTIYKKIIDYNKQENKVTISYKYAFYKVSEGPSPIDLYYTYEDALNSKNKITTYNPNDYMTDEDPVGYQGALNAAKKHDFSNELDKLNTYTYVFEIIDSKLILIDFNRK